MKLSSSSSSSSSLLGDIYCLLELNMLGESEKLTTNLGEGRREMIGTFITRQGEGRNNQ